jgi:hypothetical protein
MGTNYVKVTVEHQFRNDTTMTEDEFVAYHATLMTQEQGSMSDTFGVVPTTSIASKLTILKLVKMFEIVIVTMSMTCYQHIKCYKFFL